MAAHHDPLPSQPLPLSTAAQAALQAMKDLQHMRNQDPQALQALLPGLAAAWPEDLPEHERTLLQAQHGLLAAAADFYLLRYEAVLSALPGLNRAIDQALAADGQARAEAQSMRLQALNLAAFIAHRQGNFPVALQGYLAALNQAQAIGHDRHAATMHCNLANTYEECGLPAEAVEHHRHALRLAQALGLTELVWDVHHNLGNALAASGEVQAGLDHAHQALAGYRASGLPAKAAMACLGVAERLIELQRWDDALAVLVDACTQAVGPEQALVLAYAAHLQARIALGQGQADEARQHFALALQRCQGTGDRTGQGRAFTGLARLDLASGATAAARQAVLSALAALQGTDAGREIIDVHQCASQVAEALGDMATALGHERAAHQAYERRFNEQSALKARLLAIRHAVERAEAEAERTRLENARLTEALAEVAARIRQLDANPAASAPASTGPEGLRALGLTTRESEVLYWVTQGKTNEDVAAILGTGLPAVKKHLGNVYEKLGVENRTAAAAAARRRGAL